MGDSPDTLAAPSPAPVQESRRLLALDAARGIALLGILMVNMQLFAGPFGKFISPTPESKDLPTQICFYFEKIFCEGKFFPLFSMMFGMGLILQRASIERTAGPKAWRWTYLRRLFVLLILGALHALLLWYGDILFTYALAGFVVFLCSSLKPRTMLWIAAALLSVSVLLGAAGGALQGLGQMQPPHQTPAAATSAEPTKAAGDLAELAKTHPFFRLMDAYATGRLAGGPEESIYLQAETEAYRDGPWIDAFLFRAMTWLFIIFYSLMGFGWIVLAMFFVGAALLKSRFFEPDRAPLRKRLLVIGALVGLPLAVVSVWLIGMKAGALTGALGTALFFITGPMVAIAYLSAITLMVERAIAMRVLRVLAAVGRTALTNYLSHTLICTFIFYHWGLAQFGQWTRPERTMLALAIFAAQCILSPLWLHFFRFGPMEWIWRTLTYLKLQPLVRTRAVATAAE